MNTGNLERLNKLSPNEAREQFRRACGAEWWCNRMIAGRPYRTAQAIHSAADEAFDRMPNDGWLEAFACHPRIGDLRSLRMKFAGNREWSGGEQAGATGADEATLNHLASMNESYYQRFGWIFIVCATGKSASEMLGLLEARIDNDPAEELKTAAGEQRKITHLRLDKLLNDQPT